MHFEGKPKSFYLRFQSMNTIVKKLSLIHEQNLLCHAQNGLRRGCRCRWSARLPNHLRSNNGARCFNDTSSSLRQSKAPPTCKASREACNSINAPLRLQTAFYPAVATIEAVQLLAAAPTVSNNKHHKQHRPQDKPQKQQQHLVLVSHVQYEDQKRDFDKHKH